MPSTVEDRLSRLINKAMPQKMRKPRKRRKTKDEREIDVTRLAEVSDTELVLIAQRMGYETVSRQMPSEDIIDIILGAINSPEDVLTPVRETIYAFVKANAIMVSTMPCDLNCPACPHHMVVECYSTNRDLVE